MMSSTEALASPNANAPTGLMVDVALGTSGDGEQPSTPAAA